MTASYLFLMSLANCSNEKSERSNASTDNIKTANKTGQPEKIAEKKVDPDANFKAANKTGPAEQTAVKPVDPSAFELKASHKAAIPAFSSPARPQAPHAPSGRNTRAGDG